MDTFVEYVSVMKICEFGYGISVIIIIVIIS